MFSFDDRLLYTTLLKDYMKLVEENIALKASLEVATHTALSYKAHLDSLPIND